MIKRNDFLSCLFLLCYSGLDLLFFILCIVFFDSDFGKKFFQIMSIIGFVCGILGSLMDFVMIVLYIILVKRFVELILEENDHKVKKYLIYYSILPFCFIHIFSNIFSISEWIYIVFTP